MDVDLVLSIDHEVLLHDFFHGHALENDDLLAQIVPSYCYYTNHAAADEPPDLVVADLSIKGLAPSILLGIIVLARLLDDFL